MLVTLSFPSLVRRKLRFTIFVFRIFFFSEPKNTYIKMVRRIRSVTMRSEKWDTTVRENFVPLRTPHKLSNIIIMQFRLIFIYIYLYYPFSYTNVFILLFFLFFFLEPVYGIQLYIHIRIIECRIYFGSKLNLFGVFPEQYFDISSSTFLSFQCYIIRYWKENEVVFI